MKTKRDSLHITRMKTRMMMKDRTVWLTEIDNHKVDTEQEEKISWR
jgi:hypothetical protein